MTMVSMFLFSFFLRKGDWFLKGVIYPYATNGYLVRRELCSTSIDLYICLEFTMMKNG